MEISQQEANQYLWSEKKFLDRNLRIVAKPGITIKKRLCSDAHGDIFLLTFYKHRIELSVLSSNLHIEEGTVICRLDLNDKAHKNPDGRIIKGNHIHLYQEGYEDKFAFLIEEKIDVSPDDDYKEIINKFLQYIKTEKINFEIQQNL